MRALVITPTPTHPTIQGNRARVLQIAEGLKHAGVGIEMLYYAIDGLDGRSLDAMRNACDVLYVVPPAGFQPRRRFADAWGIDDWVGPSLVDAVRFLAGSVHYDVVVANYVWCSALLTAFPADRTVRVIDTHDAFGGRHEVARASDMDPHWFYTTVAEEGRGLDRADLVIAIQQEEADYFAGITRAEVRVIEYAVPPSFLPVRGARRPTIGYIGSGNPWNVRSVEAFDVLMAERLEAMPPDRRPDLLLFGGVTKAVRGLRAFRPIGMVDEVTDAYRKLDLIVNPMIGGTGLKIKTVEGLAFGRPVLSTRAGGAGLEALHPDLGHDSIDSLAARACHLAENPAEIETIGAAMRQSYVGYHADVSARLAKAMDTLCERTAPVTAPDDAAESPARNRSADAPSRGEREAL